MILQEHVLSVLDMIELALASIRSSYVTGALWQCVYSAGSPNAILVLQTFVGSRFPFQRVV